MSAPKVQLPLKALPGFYEALAEVEEDKPRASASYFEKLFRLGEAVIPGLDRISGGQCLERIVHAITVEQALARPRLRLVPPPRVARND